ncbi:MAG: XRE family transcriptional regulator [Candidatus Moraniibacteriota bacterium]|nr:MAG: XRE family transcriptional regulator [Candidatus Moranbacteria bacterium]
MKNETDKNAQIGAKIREARDSQGVSQLDLAQALGYESATAISLIESGDRKLKVEDLEKISNFFHRDIKFFLGQEEKVLDVKFALRADKDLQPKDVESILDFIEFAKKKRNGGNN